MFKAIGFLVLLFATPLFAGDLFFECSPNKSPNELNLRKITLEAKGPNDEAWLQVEYEDGSQASAEMVYGQDALKGGAADTFSPKVKGPTSLFIYIFPASNDPERETNVFGSAPKGAGPLVRIPFVPASCIAR